MKIRARKGRGLNESPTDDIVMNHKMIVNEKIDCYNKALRREPGKRRAFFTRFGFLTE